MTARHIAGIFLPIVLFVGLMLPLRGGFTDDGYIHIQYARNIIERGEYSFNAGHPSFGTTSPLWVMILAALGKLFGTGENLIVVSRVLSWLSGILAVGLMYVFGRRVGLERGTACLAALMLAAHVWNVRWAALSMEASTSVLAIVIVGIVFARAYETEGHGWFLGSVMALASLIRPEVYLIVPVFALALTVMENPARRRLVLETLAAYFALILPWLIFARTQLGGFLPNTAGAKSGGLILNPIVYVKKLEPIVRIVGSAEGLAVLLVVVALVVLRKRTRIVTGRRVFLLSWAIALPLTYVLFDIQVLSRYMLLTSPCVVALGLVAGEDLLRNLGVTGRPGRLALPAIVAVAVAANIVLYFAVVLTPSRAFSYGLTHDLKGLALFVREHSKPDAVVAAADIGYLAFYSGRHILDLGGLVDQTTHALRDDHTYDEIVREGLYLNLAEYPRVDFFIDRELVPNRFHGKMLSGYRFESVRVDVVDNLGIRMPGPFYYTVYRLHPVPGGARGPSG